MPTHYRNHTPSFLFTRMRYRAELISNTKSVTFTPAKQLLQNLFAYRKWRASIILTVRRCISLVNDLSCSEHVSDGATSYPMNLIIGNHKRRTRIRLTGGNRRFSLNVSCLILKTVGRLTAFTSRPDCRRFIQHYRDVIF